MDRPSPHRGTNLSFAPGGVLVDALTNDPDFTRVQQFVTSRLSAAESGGEIDASVPEAELSR